jgi:hypothetical protein
MTYYSDTSSTSSSGTYWYPPPTTKKFKLSKLKVSKVAEEKEVPKEQIILFDPKDLDI